MRIINLIEDTEAENGCLHEHGLSFYVETKKHKLIFDTGASGAFMENAARLGISLTQVDTVIISHGHYDHGGGLSLFTAQYPNARVYIRKNAFQDFYHVTAQRERYIGLDQRLNGLPGIIVVEGALKIDEELYLFTDVEGRTLWPSGNCELKRLENGRWEQDDFSHEQYLCIFNGNQKILLSGCAHNGILNILDAYQGRFGTNPDVVISGFHMMKKSGYSEQDFSVMSQTAEKLKKTGAKFYTCHCTGVLPYEVMKEQMGDKIAYVKSGETVCLSNP